MVSRYRLLWRNRCRPVSHGPPPLLYQAVLVEYPYVEPELTAEASPSKNGGNKDRGSAAFVRCVLHPLPLPLSSYLGRIPPLIGLPLKWRQQRPRICSVRSLCVASVALAVIFMPGLYPTAYRATFPAFLCGCL